MGQRVPLASAVLVRWAVIASLWMLLVSMATGQYGIANYLELRRSREILIEVNAQTLAENMLLEKRIHDLTTNPKAQAHFLKEEYGYVEPGDHLILFRDELSSKLKEKRRKF